MILINKIKEKENKMAENINKESVLETETGKSLREAVKTFLLHDAGYTDDPSCELARIVSAGVIDALQDGTSGKMDPETLDMYRQEIQGLISTLNEILDSKI